MTCQRSDLIHEMMYLDKSSLYLEKRRDNGAQIVSWRYTLFYLGLTFNQALRVCTLRREGVG